jgi:hypothetical protein
MAAGAAYGAVSRSESSMFPASRTSQRYWALAIWRKGGRETPGVDERSQYMQESNANEKILSSSSNMPGPEFHWPC